MATDYRTLCLNIKAQIEQALAADSTIVPLPPPAFAFKILVDVNQLNPDEALQASRFSADGVWAILLNSPPGIDWEKTLAALNGGIWAVSEDNPQHTSQVDLVSQSLHRLVDGAMFYNEDPLETQLTDAQITGYAGHEVPNFGAVGSRIILTTRSYAEGDHRRSELNHGLQHPNVAGAAFEFNPDRLYPAWLKFDVGARYVLSLGKKCYLLMPPSLTTSDYLRDIQQATAFFASSGVLASPDVYVVPASYVRPDMIHYLSTSSDDHNSIEAIVGWLKRFRQEGGK